MSPGGQEFVNQEFESSLLDSHPSQSARKGGAPDVLCSWLRATADSSLRFGMTIWFTRYNIPQFLVVCRLVGGSWLPSGSAGLHRSFVGSPWLRQGLRCLRMTTRRGWLCRRLRNDQGLGLKLEGHLLVVLPIDSRFANDDSYVVVPLLIARSCRGIAQGSYFAILRRSLV